MIKYLLFDLDGTLLPMDQDQFVKTYFHLLAAKLAPVGYNPEGLVKSIWNGVAAMVANDGTRSNEEIFWESFAGQFGPGVYEDKPIFEEFYTRDFQKAQSSCGFNQLAAECVHKLKKDGWPVILATNPIFPAVATHSRIGWAGLKPDDFQLVTTYENTSFCKPNPQYYQDIAHRLGVDPSECAMIGNDTEEDLAAASIGMKVFLLTDCLIDKKNTDLSQIPHGSFHEMMDWIEQVNQ